MKKRGKYILIAVLIIGAMILFMALVYGEDRRFYGRVVDADTKEPIEGAVVVAHWVEARATISGEKTRYKDVKEVLTDKNGEWSINGPKGSKGNDFVAYLTFFTGAHYTREPDFIIFKPGYCSYPGGISIEPCKKMKFTGTGEIMGGKTIEIPKLPDGIKREDRLRIIPGPVAGEGSLEKQREFKRLLNEESRYVGIPEYK